MIELVTSGIIVGRVIESVQHPSSGAVATFIGTTRDHAHGREVVSLEYDAYAPMALKTMKEVADRARAQWQILEISIVHRLGRVEIGEASIVIAVSSAHRDAAFEACRYAIDTLKAIVPIWKKEHYRDGEVWIGEEGKPMRRAPGSEI